MVAPGQTWWKDQDLSVVMPWLKCTARRRTCMLIICMLWFQHVVLRGHQVLGYRLIFAKQGDKDGFHVDMVALKYNILKNIIVNVAFKVTICYVCWKYALKVNLWKKPFRTMNGCIDESYTSNGKDTN